MLRQIEFLFRAPERGITPPSIIEVDGEIVPLLFSRNLKAKRYRLFIDRLGRPRVTIPRRGTQHYAADFVERHRPWLVEQLRKFRNRSASNLWTEGTLVLFRGVHWPLVKLVEAGRSFTVRLGNEVISLSSVTNGAGDWRAGVELHLRRLATAELPLRVRELATAHGCAVQKISVRNQRSRWGSCSRQGHVSLNWRLVQVPPEVRDYIILHELMHLREMNHSPRFWKHVAAVCPGYRESEAWLRKNPGLLR